MICPKLKNYCFWKPEIESARIHNLVIRTQVQSMRVTRISGSTCIDIFIDEDCASTEKSRNFSYPMFKKISGCDSWGSVLRDYLLRFGLLNLVFKPLFLNAGKTVSDRKRILQQFMANILSIPILIMDLAKAELVLFLMENYIPVRKKGAMWEKFSKFLNFHGAQDEILIDASSSYWHECSSTGYCCPSAIVFLMPEVKFI